MIKIKLRAKITQEIRHLPEMTVLKKLNIKILLHEENLENFKLKCHSTAMI